MNDVAGARARIKALHNSHDRLSSLLEGVAPEQVSGPSYCSDWTIAQVLSHLGSGAEIFSLMIQAVLNDEEPPGRESFPPIWDTWNAKDPVQQAEDYKVADTALLEQFESLDDEQLSGFQISMFGMELGADRLAGMRLSEHALHTWDIAAGLDDKAQLSPDAADLLIDNFAERAPQAAKPAGEPLKVYIETTEPKRSFLLSLDESATVEVDPDREASDGGSAATTLVIPSEALVRLVAGRLDDKHTPDEVRADAGILDQLRKVFPGF